MSELKPCPFCGSELLTIDCAEYFEISCAGKDCIAKTYDSKQAALEHWNTRAESPEIAALREQAKVLEESKKQMLDEIREKINNLTEYKTFVRVEGDPVPTLPQIDKWCVIWILDEMEAKL